MGIYLCSVCEEVRDSDYFPPAEVDNMEGWVCSDCAEGLAHQKNSMDGTLVDIYHLRSVVEEAKGIVDDDDMDNGPARARELYEKLTNDEKMWVNGQLRESTFVAGDTGRKRQYWTAFKGYLDYEP